jgi:hypothetical protein
MGSRVPVPAMPPMNASRCPGQVELRIEQRQPLRGRRLERLQLLGALLCPARGSRSGDCRAAVEGVAIGMLLQTRRRIAVPPTLRTFSASGRYSRMTGGHPQPTAAGRMVGSSCTVVPAGDTPAGTAVVGASGAERSASMISAARRASPRARAASRLESVASSRVCRHPVRAATSGRPQAMDCMASHAGTRRAVRAAESAGWSSARLCRERASASHSPVAV